MSGLIDTWDQVLSRPELWLEAMPEVCGPTQLGSVMMFVACATMEGHVRAGPYSLDTGELPWLSQWKSCTPHALPPPHPPPLPFPSSCSSGRVGPAHKRARSASHLEPGRDSPDPGLRVVFLLKGLTDKFSYHLGQHPGL